MRIGEESKDADWDGNWDGDWERGASNAATSYLERIWRAEARCEVLVPAGRCCGEARRDRGVKRCRGRASARFHHLLPAALLGSAFC